MLSLVNAARREMGLSGCVMAGLAMFACVLVLSGCAVPGDYSTLSGGTTFAAQDCGASPISGLRFQACEVSPWIMGSGHATSGGFSARAEGGRVPGMEGGGIDSEKVYRASTRDGTSLITVTYAVPFSSAGAFYETTPLNAASLVDPACTDIRQGACEMGSSIADLGVVGITINGRPVRLERFAILNNADAGAGFVAFIRGDRHPNRPGFTTAMMVRGFYAHRDAMTDKAISGVLTALRFQAPTVSAWN